MTLDNWKKRFTEQVLQDKRNQIQKEYALEQELIGIPFYDAPIIACASAEDPLFEEFQKNAMILGPMFRKPKEWMPEAKSVISFFLPFSEEIRKSNIENLQVPSNAWLHARIEGQAFLMEMCKLLACWMEEEGYRTLIPSNHPEFQAKAQPERVKKGEPAYVSRWSERHAAYVAGLGTFGLSKHIITEKGVSGRFGSIITDAEIAPTGRSYTDPYEYCTFCGACTHRCPVEAITLEEGKDVMACAEFIDRITEQYAPRYGCGKCQLAVPCEAGIPKRS